MIRAALLALGPLTAFAVEYASAPPAETDHERETRRERRREPPPPPDYRVVKDLRLSVGAVSAPTRITTDSFSVLGDQTYQVDRRAIPAGSLTFVYGRLHDGGGPLIATGVDLVKGTAYARTPAGTLGFDLERYDALIKVGYGLPLGPLVHLELLPYLGVGFGSTSAHGGGYDSQVTGEAGVDLGVYVRAGGARLGVSGGWGGATSWGDTTLHGQGPQAMASLGVAF